MMVLKCCHIFSKYIKAINVVQRTQRTKALTHTVEINVGEQPSPS